MNVIADGFKLFGIGMNWDAMNSVVKVLILMRSVRSFSCMARCECACADNIMSVSKSVAAEGAQDKETVRKNGHTQHFSRQT